MSTLDWSAAFEALATDQSFRSRGRTITEADLVGFSTLTGDFHPQHTDAEWSAAGRFGERIAHGMLLVSYAVGLVPFDPARVLALRRIKDVVFKRPAPLGATIHVTGRIAELHPVSTAAGLVTFSWDIRDGTETLLARARIEVLWSRDHSALTEQEGDEQEVLDFPPGVIPC